MTRDTLETLLAEFAPEYTYQQNIDSPEMCISNALKASMFDELVGALKYCKDVVPHNEDTHIKVMDLFSLYDKTRRIQEVLKMSKVTNQKGVL